MKKPFALCVSVILVAAVSAIPCSAQFFVSGSTPQRSTSSLGPASPEVVTGVYLDVYGAIPLSPRYYELKAGYFLDALRKESIGLEIGLLHAGPFTETARVMNASGGRSVIPFESYALPVDSGHPYPTPSGLNILSFNVVGRLGYYKGDLFPYGKIRPYLGAGLETVLAGPEGLRPASLLDYPGRDWPAVEAFIGTQIFLLRHVAFFSEYKYTHFPTLALDVYPGIGGETRPPTHHFISGLSVQF